MDLSSTINLLLLSIIFVSHIFLSRAENENHAKGIVTKEKWDIHMTLNTNAVDSETLDLACVDDHSCQAFAINSKTSSCINGTCVCQQKNFKQNVSCGNLGILKMKKVGSKCEAEPPYCRGMGAATCNDHSNTCLCDKGYIESVDKRKCISGEILIKSLFKLGLTKLFQLKLSSTMFVR